MKHQEVSKSFRRCQEAPGVSLSLGAPSAPASRKQIDAAEHDQELVYYQEENREPEEVEDGDEELDELGENVQGLKGVGDGGGDPEELGADL